MYNKYVAAGDLNVDVKNSTSAVDPESEEIHKKSLHDSKRVIIKVLAGLCRRGNDFSLSESLVEGAGNLWCCCQGEDC